MWCSVGWMGIGTNVSTVMVVSSEVAVELGKFSCVEGQGLPVVCVCNLSSLMMIPYCLWTSCLWISSNSGVRVYGKGRVCNSLRASTRVVGHFGVTITCVGDGVFVNPSNLLVLLSLRCRGVRCEQLITNGRF